MMTDVLEHLIFYGALALLIALAQSSHTTNNKEQNET